MRGLKVKKKLKIIFLDRVYFYRAAQNYSLCWKNKAKKKRLSESQNNIFN